MMKRASRCTILLLLVAGAMHAAEPGSGGLRAHFPEGSITTTQQAEEALKAVRVERKVIEAAFRDARKACQEKFAVTDCVNEAKVERRQKLKEADAVEIQAKRVKRVEKARRAEEQRLEREQRRSEAQHKREAEAEAGKRIEKSPPDTSPATPAPSGAQP